MPRTRATACPVGSAYPPRMASPTVRSTQLRDDDGQPDRRFEQHGVLRREHHRHELQHPSVAERTEPAGNRGADGASGITTFADTFTYIPLTTTECAASTNYRWDRQTNWIDGDYRHTLYDHYYTPNSTTYDCLRGPMHGWRTARSRHPGGVNILFVDGSVHFVKNTINLTAWQAIATVAGGEVVSSDSY